jgi:hypothetical protein
VYVGLRVATCVDLCLRPATYVYVRLCPATRRRHSLSTRRLHMSTCVYGVDARRHTLVNFIMLFYQIGQLNHSLHSHSALSLCIQFPRIGRGMCTFVYIGLRVSTSVYRVVHNSPFSLPFSPFLPFSSFFARFSPLLQLEVQKG